MKKHGVVTKLDKLLKHWINGAKSLNMTGLSTIISKSLILYIATHFPHIDNLYEELLINALPLYSYEQ